MRHLIVDLESLAIDDADTYLEPVSAPANYKDPEKIAAYQAEARQGQLDKAALDIDLARIVALGMLGEHDEKPQVLLAPAPGDEAALLLSFWATWAVKGRPTLVTYNGLGFDLPLLLRRSLYLNVAAPHIQVDRFKHPQVIDLMQVLSYDGKLKFRGLGFYANRFNIQTDDDISGKDIAAAVRAGNWDAVQRHCASDVLTTRALGRRMGLLGQAQPEMVA